MYCIALIGVITSLKLKNTQSWQASNLYNAVLLNVRASELLQVRTRRHLYSEWAMHTNIARATWCDVISSLKYVIIVNLSCWIYIDYLYRICIYFTLRRVYLQAEILLYHKDRDRFPYAPPSLSLHTHTHTYIYIYTYTYTHTHTHTHILWRYKNILSNWKIQHCRKTKYRVLQNDCWDFNNLSYAIHLR